MIFYWFCPSVGFLGCGILNIQMCFLGNKNLKNAKILNTFQHERAKVPNVVQGYPRFLMVPQDYYCLKLTKSLHAVSRACKQFSKIYICVSQALDRKKL